MHWSVKVIWLNHHHSYESPSRQIIFMQIWTIRIIVCVCFETIILLQLYLVMWTHYFALYFWESPTNYVTNDDIQMRFHKGISFLLKPEPPSTNKWQLDKWLNKVNPHNKPLAKTQSESHGLGSSQPEDGQATENQSCSKSKPSAALAQADPKDRALLSPIREKAKPKTGQKGPDGKGTKVKAPASVDLPPSRRSTGKKQPKKVEQSSSSEEHNWPRPVNSSTTSTTPKEKEPPPLDPPKPRGKAPGGKTAPRKEPRSTTVTTPAASTTSTISTAPDKKKHRGPSKIIPKSKEFIETESSSSECHSDPEELSKVHLPCPGPSSLNFKSKDCNSNILSVSSLASTSSTSIPDPAATDLLEDPLFSPISMVQNELLSPLRDFEDIKSLWVKIELSLLSRIPGQDPPEPLSAKAECRETSFKHRRQQSPASIPSEKPTSKSKRKHKASACFLCIILHKF